MADGRIELTPTVDSLALTLPRLIPATDPAIVDVEPV
jgi:hypothetical protein